MGRSRGTLMHSYFNLILFKDLSSYDANTPVILLPVNYFYEIQE